jgi:hypothetical protein
MAQFICMYIQSTYSDTCTYYVYLSRDLCSDVTGQKPSWIFYTFHVGGRVARWYIGIFIPKMTTLWILEGLGMERYGVFHTNLVLFLPFRYTFFVRIKNWQPWWVDQQPFRSECKFLDQVGFFQHRKEMSHHVSNSPEFKISSSQKCTPS